MRRRHIFICRGMLGKSKYDAQVKPTMKSSDPTDVRNQLVEFPPTIKMQYGNVGLAADVIHVNYAPFITYVSNYAYYGTFNIFDNIKGVNLEQGIQNIIRCYAVRGFNVVVVMLDMQFKCIKDSNCLVVLVNIVIIGEHVKRIELFHRLT